MKSFILLVVCAITVTAHQANAQWAPPFFGSPDIINTNPGNVQIRRDLELLGNNNGTPTFGAIRFGIASGETIASKRTAGGNQFGLDFYTAFQRRMAITQGGDVEILGNNNGASTLGALRFGIGSGEAIASKRTAGGNQFGLDFYTLFQNRMSITQGGNVGIGTTAPGSHKVKIAHGNFGLNLENVATGNDWELWTSNVATNAPLNLYYNGVFKGSFNASTGAYTSIAPAVSASSAERLKTNIKAMPAVLEKVNQLKPVSNQVKASNTPDGNMPESYGFMAQDVMEIFPNLVTHNVDKERGLDTYTMDYSGFGIIAIMAIQELQQTNQQLEERVAKLEAALSAIKPGNANDASSKMNFIGTDATLEQNTPNPTGSGTSIRYRIPEGSRNAQLIIADNLGRIVRQVPVSSGNGVVNIDASILSKGIYNYSLWVNDKLIGSKKMVITNK